MITIKHKGSFTQTERFFNRLTKIANLDALKPYAEEGVRILAAATPKDTGKTADSWSYKIVRGRNKASIYWCNDNINDGYIVAILLQYGHATSSGAMVEGYDYINPAMAPLFDKIDAEVCREIRQ